MTLVVEHNLLHSPSQIYNMDESGNPLDSKAPNVVAVKGLNIYPLDGRGKLPSWLVRMLLVKLFLPW